MSFIARRSLQLRLALRLGFLFLAATVLMVSALLYQTYTVAEENEAEELLHAMLREFFFDAAWTIPFFLVATLLVGIFAIRSGLRPLREASMQAMMIKPGAISRRLPMDGLPNEIKPLVAAVNSALDRLEQGFAQQRQFTANAAHELRTPLAIISGALETMDGNGELAKLREDAARMNRLVDQLLRVARLDALPLDVSGDVDLCAAVVAVVEYMAPLAISRERSIAFTSPNQPIVVKGDRAAIEDAIRNLIENAIHYTPPQSEVLVEIMRDGSVSIADSGPGIKPEDRERIFERFWRGKRPHGSGAGLGLAIVRETMKSHGGTVEVSDNSGGGARFVLRFRYPLQDQNP